MLATILAIAIILKAWHILLTITVLTFIIAAILESKESGGYINLPVYLPMWFVGNLIMWLIYFIIV